MNLTEMHVWFRQYAQQMGMQNVRAILPEQIDILINTSISDIVNQIIRENIGVTNDRIITDNSKLGQINALRSLYKVVELDMTGVTPFMQFLKQDILTGMMSNKQKSGQHRGEDVSSTVPPDFLYLVDFSIKYKKANYGFFGTENIDPYDQHYAGQFDTDALETNYFPIRLIDDAYLADTLNDFVLKNRIRTPILVIYNNNTFDLYIDSFNILKHSIPSSGGQEVDTYILQNSLLPYKFRMSYLAEPDKVQYLADVGAQNVDCNLPESMHIDILKHAVDLYRISISGNLYSAQQQQQNQNREMTRNNARPDNDGYQN